MCRTWALIGVVVAGLMVGRAGGVVAQNPMEEARAVALRMFDGVPDEDCLTGNNPALRTCVTGPASAEAVARGIATFNLLPPSRIEGALAVLGRTPAEEWGFWLITQTLVYQLLALPGEMIICAEGTGLNVRAAPSVEAEIVAALPEGTRVLAEAFVLAEPGLYAPRMSPRWGAGWYRLSAPVEGWAHSRYLSNTIVDANSGSPECSYRDSIERMPR